MFSIDTETMEYARRCEAAAPDSWPREGVHYRALLWEVQKYIEPDFTPSWVVAGEILAALHREKIVARALPAVRREMELYSHSPLSRRVNAEHTANEYAEGDEALFAEIMAAAREGS